MLYFYDFSNQELQDISMELNLIPNQEKRLIENWYRYDSEFLLSLLVCTTIRILVYKIVLVQHFWN